MKAVFKALKYYTIMWLAIMAYMTVSHLILAFHPFNDLGDVRDLCAMTTLVSACCIPILADIIRKNK